MSDGGVVGRVRQDIVTICRQMKDEAVTLVDSFSYTDFIVNSPIGAEDGQVGTHFLPSAIVLQCVCFVFESYCLRI